MIWLVTVFGPTKNFIQLTLNLKLLVLFYLTTMQFHTTPASDTATKLYVRCQSVSQSPMLQIFNIIFFPHPIKIKHIPLTWNWCNSKLLWKPNTTHFHFISFRLVSSRELTTKRNVTDKHDPYYETAATATSTANRHTLLERFC